MNFRDFILYTAAGAGIWNIILAVIGFYLYEIREQIFPYLGHILIALGALFVIWLIIKSRRQRLRSKVMKSSEAKDNLNHRQTF